MDHAPDKELLLTAKVTFHHFVRARELDFLGRDDFYFDVREFPVAVKVRNADRRDGRIWRLIPIDSSHRPGLKGLLPSSGPLFVHANPFARLQNFAGKLGIKVTRRTALLSCVAHAWGAGMSGEEISVRLGQDLASRRPTPIFRPGQLEAEAADYFAVDFTTGPDLPHYCGPEALPRVFRENGRRP